MKKLVILLLLILPIALFGLVSYLGREVVKPGYTSVEGVEIRVNNRITKNKENNKNLIIDKDEVYQLTFDVLPLIATNKSVSFYSVDSTYVSIDENGLITGAEYTTKPIVITVTTEMNKKEDFVYVTVSSTEAREVIFSESTINLEILQRHVLDYTIYPMSAQIYTTVTFVSSNPEIIKVDEDGMITALRKGEAEITITTNNGKTDTVTVNGVLGYETYLPPGPIVTVKDIYQFEINCNSDDYEWRIKEGGENYASIDQNGLLTFKVKNQPVTVQFFNHENPEQEPAEVVITSVHDVITKIDIGNQVIDMTIRQDGKMKLNPTIFPKDATVSKLIYEVTHGMNILSVDNIGNLTAMGNGKAKVKISSEAIDVTIDIDIYCPPYTLEIDSRYQKASNLLKDDGISLARNESVTMGYTISLGSHSEVHQDIEILMLDSNVVSIERSDLPQARTRTAEIAEITINSAIKNFTIKPLVTGKFNLILVSKSEASLLSYSQIYRLNINDGVNVRTFEEMKLIIDNPSTDKAMVINLLNDIIVDKEVAATNTLKNIDPTQINGFNHHFVIFMIQNQTEINGNSFEINARNVQFTTTDDWYRENPSPGIIFVTTFHGKNPFGNSLESQLVLNHLILRGNSDNVPTIKPAVVLQALYVGNIEVNGISENRNKVEGISDFIKLNDVEISRVRMGIRINNVDRVQFDNVIFTEIDGSIGYMSQVRSVKLSNLVITSAKGTGIEFLADHSLNCGYDRTTKKSSLTGKDYEEGAPMRVEYTGNLKISCWASVAALDPAYFVFVQILKTQGKLRTEEHYAKLDANGKLSKTNSSDYVIIPFIAAATNGSFAHPGNYTIFEFERSCIDLISHDAFTISAIGAPELAGKGLNSRLWIVNIGLKSPKLNEALKNGSAWPMLDCANP